MSGIPSYQITPCGDHALTVQFGESISPEVHRHVINLYKHLSQLSGEGIRDIIPAYTTVTVVYDLAFFLKKYAGQPVSEKLSRFIQEAIAEMQDAEIQTKRLVKVPVCYDASLAPDLFSLAEEKNITTEELIRLHTETIYKVYMLGFLPGFAYMGSVDAKIAAARKTDPRTKVPAGSVGIAGTQTGIYPFESPGGWQLIGQTPLPVFDAGKNSPCLFSPGDTVQFFPITLTEFKKMQNA